MRLFIMLALLFPACLAGAVYQVKADPDRKDNQGKYYSKSTIQYALSASTFDSAYSPMESMLGHSFRFTHKKLPWPVAVEVNISFDNTSGTEAADPDEYSLSSQELGIGICYPLVESDAVQMYASAGMSYTQLTFKTDFLGKDSANGLGVYGEIGIQWNTQGPAVGLALRQNINNLEIDIVNGGGDHQRLLFYIGSSF